MAIIRNIEKEKWERIQFIIQQVILRRKCEFDRKMMLLMIKQQLLINNMDVSVMDCSYFHILFLNTLDELVEQGVLYEINQIYFPVDYMIFRDYDTKCSELLYYSCSSSFQSTYINIENLERRNSKNHRDFLLIGGLDKEEKDFISPVVPLLELHELYQDFLEEGKKKEEIIRHILNYYPMEYFFQSDQFPNTMIIHPKAKVRNLK